jgi:hypothetical protein
VSLPGSIRVNVKRNSPEGEVSLHVPKNLFKKCIKKHPPAKNKGGGSPIGKKVVESTPDTPPIDTGCEPDDDCDHQIQRIGPPTLIPR